MTDVDRKTKNIVVRCLRPYKGYGLPRETAWNKTSRLNVTYFISRLLVQTRVPTSESVRLYSYLLILGSPIDKK